MKHVLVFGHNGQLARALANIGDAQDLRITRLGSEACDLMEDPGLAANAIESAENIDAVINASAYTAVDRAETETDAAHTLNAVAPAIMAQACAVGGIPFLHVSTDYVFQGLSQRPYLEIDALEPINAYGASKAKGEAAVIAANPDASIFRTSWVYDAASPNFLTTMLRIGAKDGPVTVVDDQIGRPTYAPHLAEALLLAAAQLYAAPEKSGLYHLTGEGKPVSWYGFAKAIFEQAKLPASLSPIPTSGYPTPAKRPAYSVLNTDTFYETFGHRLPAWESGLSEALSIVRAKG